MLHALATNAVKYGALREPDGRVAISWTVNDMPTGKVESIDWRKTGVLLTTVPTGKISRRVC